MGGKKTAYNRGFSADSFSGISVVDTKEKKD
jgi:hypothetical protein